MSAGNCKMALHGVRRRWWRSAAWGAWVVALTAGCTAPGSALVESPLSVSQQQAAVLEIVPRGTPRGDAEKRLKAAGIEFTPGGNGSIYYLSLWNRPDGERWHVNVALLFDSAGKLYQTRPADSTTSVMGGKPGDDPERPAVGTGVPLASLRGEELASLRGEEEEEAAGGPARVAFPAQNVLGRGSAP